MKINAILETILYGKNLNELADFYKNILGFEEVAKTEERNVVLSCGTSALILFNSEASIKKDGLFPYHGTSGPGHIAFPIKDGELHDWKTLLEKNNIKIEKEHVWQDGSISIYFRDPADNSVELAPSSLWNGLGKKLLNIK